ncbi:MAG: porphobilinogen synthase [Kiritimatiellia bacterium]
MNAYPERRMRRLRQTANLRRMMDMEFPGAGRFIWPVFVVDGKNVKRPIEAMPGQFHYSPDELIRALDPLINIGLGGILIFGVIPDQLKDQTGHAALDPEGVVPRTVSLVCKQFPDLVVFTDVCLCGHTVHGHCGPLDNRGDVDNDAAVDLLARAALIHASAGATGVAPSAMMDGQVQAIRSALDAAGHARTLIMSYSTKFASSFYGPFRQAAGSAPGRGDRKTYQASYADPSRALLESGIDEKEGADILMVKPALCYLDMITRLRERTDLPIAAFNVSGEYSMLIAAAERGWGDLQSMARESIMGIRRAGADIIISYWASRYEEIFLG